MSGQKSRRGWIRETDKEKIKCAIKRPGSLARAFYLLLKQGGDMKSVLDTGTFPKSSFKKVG